MAQTFAAHACQCDFYTALIADNPAMLHTLVLAAQAFPIGYRSKDAGTEQPVSFGFKSAVVDGLRLGDFAMGPGSNFFRRCKRNSDAIEIRNDVASIVR